MCSKCSRPPMRGPRPCAHHREASSSHGVKNEASVVHIVKNERQLALDIVHRFVLDDGIESSEFDPGVCGRELPSYRRPFAIATPGRQEPFQFVDGVDGVDASIGALLCPRRAPAGPALLPVTVWYACSIWCACSSHYKPHIFSFSLV